MLATGQVRPISCIYNKIQAIPNSEVSSFAESGVPETFQQVAITYPSLGADRTPPDDGVSERIFAIASILHTQAAGQTRFMYQCL